VKVQDQKPAARADAMWKVLGQDTLEVMADGCMCLAQLWDSAWAEGNGDARIQALGSIEQAALEELYQSPDFLPSHTLDTIGPLLAGAPAHSASVVPLHRSRARPAGSAGARRRRA
jgi:hypothetical protein